MSNGHENSNRIEDGREQQMYALAGQPVLVHCRAGISRSAAIVIAYLVHSGAFLTIQPWPAFVLFDKVACDRLNLALLDIFHIHA